MRLLTLLLMACTALGLCACTPGIAAPGTPASFASACSRPNEGHLIAVEGYLRLPPSLDSAESVMLRLYPDPSFMGSPIGVMMSFGDRANQAHRIKSSYQDSDLKVYLANGTPVPYETRVRVSGRLVFPVQPQDYQCFLQSPYVEAAR